MKIKILEVQNGDGKTLGVEFEIDDLKYFQLLKGNFLTGLRLGEIVPGLLPGTLKKKKIHRKLLLLKIIEGD